MDKESAIKFLTKNGEDNHLKVPCSRYGNDTETVAPTAYAAAVIVAGESGTELTESLLDYVMGLAVNNHDDIGYVIANYGEMYSINPKDYLDDPKEFLTDN